MEVAAGRPLMECYRNERGFPHNSEPAHATRSIGLRAEQRVDGALQVSVH